MKISFRLKTKLLKPTVVVCAVFLLAMIPLLLIAPYDHPEADDFTYGLRAAKAWAANGSLFSVFAAAWHTVRDTYFNWQGSFSGIFVMAVQPAVYGEHMYFLTPLLTLGLFLFGTFFLLKTVLRDYMQADLCSYLIIGFVITAVSLNYMPSPVEGIYWYNGAVYYTGFYGVSLIVFALVIYFFHTEKRNSKILCGILALTLSFVLGGSNFTTALETALVLAVLFLSALQKRRQDMLLSVGTLGMDLVGLFISINAPGNAIRKQNFQNTPDALHAVYVSFQTALHFLYQWTTPVIFICLLFLAPLVYRIVRKAQKPLPSPLFVLAISFCLFAAQFTPPLYALGFPGPNRLLNIVYFSYFWFLLINLICSLGWVARKLHRRRTQNAEEAVFQAGSQLAEEHMTAILICFAVLLTCACVGSRNIHKLTSVSAADSLRTGQAQQYSREADNRLKIYRSNRGQNVTVDKFTVRPYVLCFKDIEPVTTNWRNQAVSQYYELKTVKRKS
jgi:hypothetical protein